MLSTLPPADMLEVCGGGSRNILPFYGMLKVELLGCVS